MNSPLVSIISVNYNEPEETIEFLDSLYDSDYKNFETIIVDNGSKRKVNKNIESKYNDLTCIIHDINLGFAGGNNLGIVIAKGDYIIFLNNDTLVPPDFISTMVSFMEANDTVGIASPKVIYPNKIVQYAGATRINPFTGRGKTIGLLEEDHGQYNEIYPTDLPHGAAMIVSQKAIKKVGHIPEEYFLYYEELDWCMQIKSAGFKMYYVGNTHIIHKESVSVGPESPLKVYYMNRNRVLFQLRNTKGFEKISGIIFFFLIALPKGTLHYLLSRKFNHLVNLWKGALWHFNKNYVFKNYK